VSVPAARLVSLRLLKERLRYHESGLRAPRRRGALVVVNRGGAQAAGGKGLRIKNKIQNVAQLLIKRGAVDLCQSPPPGLRVGVPAFAGGLTIS